MGVLQVALATAAIVGQLLLGIAAALRRGRSAVAMPLAVLAALLSTWTATSLAHEVLPEPPGPFRGWWHYIDVAISPLLPSVVLILILRFTGEVAHRWERALIVLSGVFALASALAAGFEPFRAFEDWAGWEVVYLGLTNPIILLALYRLYHYLRTVKGPEERARAHLLASALVVGWCFGLTEVLHDLAPAIPRLGKVGVLVSSFMLAVGVLRLSLLGPRAGWLVAAFPVFGLLLGLGFFALGGREPDFFLATLVPSSLIGLAIAWPIWQSRRERERRDEHLAYLGQLVAQMTHDLKNPVAAIQSAADYLLVEVDAGRPVAPHRWYLEQVRDSARRLGEAIDAYRRLGRLELQRSEVDLAELVEVAAGFLPPTVDVERRLAPAPVVVDRDLVISALENLFRNALQAAGPSGRIVAGCEGGDLARVWVEDSGPGIPPRDRARVLEDFYTTKPGGTGLGLPFVRRVAEAHGGFIRLEDGRSTSGLRVVLGFPPRG